MGKQLELIDSHAIPIGRHDEQVMAHPGALQVFEDYIRHKQDLLTFLQDI